MSTDNNQSLKDQKVLITRPLYQSKRFVEQLKSKGAIPVVLPTIEIVKPEDSSSVDQAINDLDQFDWLLFTSGNGVKFFFERLEELGKNRDALKNAKIAVVGTATQSALEKAGLKADFVPSEFIAEALGKELPDVEGKKILLPQSEIARENLIHLLKKRKADVRPVIAYRTVKVLPAKEEVEKAFSEGIDFITFTSASTVTGFVKLLDQYHLKLTEAKVACIGPVTASKAKEQGLEPDVVAQPYTIEGLIDGMLKSTQ